MSQRERAARPTIVTFSLEAAAVPIDITDPIKVDSLDIVKVRSYDVILRN